MEFKLTDKYLEIKNSIHDYCQRELAPQAMALDVAPADKAQEMIKVRLLDLGQKGFLGLGFPSEAGGNDGDLLSATILLQELGQACPATALAVFTSVGLCARAIHNWGAAAEKEQYLADLLSGNIIGGYSSLEPEAGFDTWELKTTAAKDDKGYHLNGMKKMALNVPTADITIITAAKAGDSPGLYLITKETSGLEVSPAQEKLGCRGLPTADLKLTNCPAVALGDKVGNKAVKILRSHEHLLLAALSTGVIRAAMITGGVYARDHQAGGKPLARHQEISFKLADTFLYQDTVQILIYRCLWFMAEDNPEAEVLASSAKLFASEAAVKAADYTMQITAQEGYCQGSQAERLFRDAKLLEILGDQTEKHRMYIADQVLAQY